MRTKKTIGNLFVLGIGLFLGFILCEMVLRLALPQKLVKTCYQFDPQVTLSGVPNCSFVDDWEEEIPAYKVDFNNVGFRMKEDVLDDDENLVACIGDSFAYGWGVEIEDAFFGKIKDEFNKQNTTSKLINAGFPSYSTGHCTKTLERLDDKVKVDKAIYFMFFNDVFDNVRNDRNYVAYTYTIDEQANVTLNEVVKQEGPFYKKILRWFYKHSHLAILVRKSMPDFKKGQSHSGPRVEDTMKQPQIDTMTMVTLAHIDKLNQLCEQRDIQLQIIWIPCWKALNLENDYKWENYFPFERLKTAIAAKYPFYDPTEKMNLLLENRHDKLSHYYFSEGHYNENGNALFYESIKKEVLGFLDKEEMPVQ